MKGGTAKRNNFFGAGTGQVWEFWWNCLGHEALFEECIADPENWSDGDCSVDGDAGVVCYEGKYCKYIYSADILFLHWL